MPDYKRAFEILNKNLKVSVCDGKEVMQMPFYLLDTEECENTITKEEYDCINDCLNAEEDSLEKIIKEFKELGIVVDEELTDDNAIVLKIIDTNDILLEINNKCVTFNHYSHVSIKVLRLINRMLRLEGVEV